MSYKKKLIEVALPLDAINKESAREKSLRHGHPSTLHLWWSRKPLATTRAVLFASLVDDPSEHAERFPNEQQQDEERERLFKLIEHMVQWEAANDEEVMKQVREEIRQATGGELPVVLDPFAGGGSIPLEAQRLGLEARAGDLNPVAVLITRALIEIPPKFAGRPPVSQAAGPELLSGDWRGARGLAADIRYYGKWLRDEAARRIGHLYPPVTLPAEQGGGEATVIAWLWARTVSCPNPACGAQMPLASKWWLSKKKGREAWVEPVIDLTVMPPTVRFTIKAAQQGEKPQEGTVNRKGARCVACNAAVSFEHIRNEGKAGRMGQQLMAIVAEGQRGRVYLIPDENQRIIASEAHPEWCPEASLPHNPRDFKTPNYGMRTFGDLFTPRQLVALTTFAGLVQEARERVLADARQARLPDDERPLHKGGTGAPAYADAIATYLGMAIDRLADRNSSICSWDTGYVKVRNTFARQAIPMVWDFAEANPFSASTGNFNGAVDWIAEVIEIAPCYAPGEAQQRDATASINGVAHPLISTDPPYYDNVGYADLSDFFYVWLRRSLGAIHPDLFRTLLVPKAQELVATPYRFGGSKKKAQEFFEQGLGQAFERMRAAQHPGYPLTVYYAFKQAEVEEHQDDEAEAGRNGNGAKVVASTGWETMLEGLVRAGFIITGTWPMRTEMMNRSVGLGTNALASSIVLVCRPRPLDAPLASRRQFLAALRSELPVAIRKLQHSNIAAVDLAQASIGPGMAIYSRYRRVIEADGSPLRVRTALQLINSALDELLAEQEGEFDLASKFAIAWFEQYAFEAGEYGMAETLSKARNVGIQSLVEMGWLEARGGRVRLLRREELPKAWHPERVDRLATWEVMQRMIHALESQGGEQRAAALLRATGAAGSMARDLAYRLYTVCERKNWTQEALAYNGLVTSWSEISRLARREAPDSHIYQTSFSLVESSEP